MTEPLPLTQIPKKFCKPLVYYICSCYICAMFVQCSSVKRKNKVSYNRKLVVSYRIPGEKHPKVRTVQKLEGLPIAERAKLIYEYGGKKHLTSQEWAVLDELGLLTPEEKPTFQVGDVYRGAGTAVAYKHLRESGMFQVLDQHLKRNTSALLRELIIEQLLYPQSKLSFVRHRQSSLLYVLSGKRLFSEDQVYAALDELNARMTNIKKGLNQKIQSQSTRLLLYDLSNSYFTGTKAELAGRGDSKEKRHDRYIVSYGLVMNEHNMPLDLRIWKGGTADSKTVLSTFKEWKEAYLSPEVPPQEKQAIWVGDRSMSGEPTLDEIQQIGLNYITGLPGSAQQALLLLKHEAQPELFDKKDLASLEHEGKRYVLCCHQSKGYRNERKAFEKRRKVYNALCKIRDTPQNKNSKKLYHRAMKVLEKHQQTKLWDIQVDPIEGNEDKEPRYRLNFQLKRKAVAIQNKIGHYYLLQTDLEKDQISDKQVMQSYHKLMQVEKSFRDIKSQVAIRPIRHRKKERIKGHLYLCYLSLWLSKYIENQWKAQSLSTEVGPTLKQWDRELLLCETVDQNHNVVELKWNEGQNAHRTREEIANYQEDDVLKAKW